MLRSDASLQVVSFDATASYDPDGTITHYAWDFGDGTSAVGSEVSHEFPRAGCFEVVLTVTDDRGASSQRRQVVAITTQRPQAPGSAQLGFLPADRALIPRDRGSDSAPFIASASNVVGPWPEAEVIVQAEGGAPKRFVGQICNQAFAFAARVPVALADHRVELALIAGTERTLLYTAGSVVAGDVFLVQGQSNAVSGRWSSAPVVEENAHFVRSFGDHSREPQPVEENPEWHFAGGESGFGPGIIGRWPLRMASNLVGEHRVPLAVINHALGGQRISYFQRNDTDPTDTSTNYGQALYRLDRAGIRNHVRAVLYVQGENDGDDAEGHRAGFAAVHEDWHADFPALEQVYVGQVREGCGNPSLELRDAQRQFGLMLPNTTVMATNGLDGHDGCHFRYDMGYRELGDWFSQLVARDLYGATPQPDTEAVDVENARLDGNTLRILTTGDASALLAGDGVETDFSLVGTSKTVERVQVVGKTLELTLAGDGADPTEVRYSGHPMAGPWITNARGIGLLSFILTVEPL